VRGLNVGTPFTQSNLDACWSPSDKVSQFPLSYSLERLMHLSGVNLSLDNVKDRNVRTILRWLRDQNVFGVK